MDSKINLYRSKTDKAIHQNHLILGTNPHGGGGCLGKTRNETVAGILRLLSDTHLNEVIICSNNNYPQRIDPRCDQLLETEEIDAIVSDLRTARSDIIFK